MFILYNIFNNINICYWLNIMLNIIIYFRCILNCISVDITNKYFCNDNNKKKPLYNLEK